jgi:hypothetical protein
MSIGPWSYTNYADGCTDQSAGLIQANMAAYLQAQDFRRHNMLGRDKGSRKLKDVP